MKIYLAGPDVFLPDAVEIGRKKAAIGARYGMRGLYPLDNAVDLSAADASLAIFKGNEAMMEAADLPGYSALGNTVRGNSIASNAGLGIDLAGNLGVTPNDSLDADVDWPQLPQIELDVCLAPQAMQLGGRRPTDETLSR